MIARDTVGTCTLHVCTSCRPGGAPREPKENRPGFLLYNELREAFSKGPLKDKVKVLPAGCLSVCLRPCGIALSSNGAWTYLFGDQLPNKTAQDILDCVSHYLETSNGFMARENRPKALQRSILGRVPSIKEERPCT